MIKYNDRGIIVGFIKQLLASFNLPSIRTYKGTYRKTTTQGRIVDDSSEFIPDKSGNPTDIPSWKWEYEDFNEEVEKEPLIDDALYIKGDHIVRYNEESKSFLPFVEKDSSGKIVRDRTSYVFNEKLKNLTKNMRITSQIYDSYTHTYLGNYLRFIRDYKKLDLMSLYNCFSNEVASTLNIKGTFKNFEFNTNNTNFTIYMIPVKLFQNYTIALESSQPVELVCGLYDKTQDSNSKWQYLYEETYEKARGISFNSPFLYTKLKDYAESYSFKELIDREKDLKLFIKVPFNTKTSIVVLEGDYRENTSGYLKTNSVDGFDKVYHKTITNFKDHKKDQKEIDRTDFRDFKPISKSQLLQFNSGVSHPFADKLIEYLTDNAITPIDSISDNIERLQRVLKERSKITTQNDVDHHFNYLNKEEYQGDYAKLKPEMGIKSIKHPGIWEDSYSATLYDLADQEGLLKDGFDYLGYVDKEVETELVAEYSDKEGNITVINSDVDIYGGK